MNIVFWSPLYGHGATTSNLNCLAVMSSLMYCYKTVSLQSEFPNNYYEGITDGQICENNFDIAFIDYCGRIGQNESDVFTFADLLVVNLNQNPELIGFAKSQLEKLEYKCSVMYVIGRYDASNNYTLKSIMKKFQIPYSDIGVIPYNSEFMDAVLSGGTRKFLEANIGCSRRNYNYGFIKEVEILTDKLITKAGLKHG